MPDKEKNLMHEPQADYEKEQLSDATAFYKGFVHKSEDEKLMQDVLRPDIEKLHLFTKMLRRNNTLNKAVTSNK
jgi:hypothetical protein